MAEAYDLVVIGAGHNGLVTAAYLARSGRKVAVLEARSAIGGALASREEGGYRYPLGATLCGLLRSEIIEDLGLKARGLEFVAFDPAVVALGEEGKALPMWRDGARTIREISAFSAADAESYPKFRALMEKMADVIEPLLMRTPPSVPPESKAEQFLLLGRGWALRRMGKEDMRKALRFPPLSLKDFLGEWFETEPLKASLALDGLQGTFRGPYSPGTAFGLLHHFLARDGWNLVKGGMHNLAKALATSAEAAGATIRTGAEVKRILTEDGVVRGVELSSGEEVAANAVASSADPKRTFLTLVDPAELEPSFAHQVRNIQMEGSISRVNLALDGLPRMPTDGGSPPAHLRISPSVEYLERAYDDAKRGGFSAHPILDVVLPSVVDPGVAPAGRHLMAVTVQYTPYHLRKGSWDDWRDELGELVVDTLEDQLPGLKGNIAHRQVLTPLDLETQLGLTEGHVYHGEMTLNQLFILRPVPGWARYRTPIEGLYLCGSGAHPGGGVTGAPGYNAAREIFKDIGGRKARR
jgi:phytoene dehydrogenase-like protein